MDLSSLDPSLFLVLALILAVIGAALGFMRGDARRRGEAGLVGPRGAPSVGEALRRAQALRGRVPRQ